jgi:hypothetical protein
MENKELLNYVIIEGLVTGLDMFYAQPRLGESF